MLKKKKKPKKTFEVEKFTRVCELPSPLRTLDRNGNHAVMSSLET